MTSLDDFSEILTPDKPLAEFTWLKIGGPAQYLAELLPLTHFVRLIRGVILKGARLGQMMGDVYALFTFTMVMLVVAIGRFKKRLE